MGRRKSLDIESAMPVIVQMFWTNGFDRVTLEDVAKALGVTKPTLFRTIGDKEALFLAALEDYYATHIRPGEIRLAKSETLREGMQACFDVATARILDNENPVGCFLTDAAMSGAFSSGPVAERLRGLQAGTLEILQQKVTTAISQGELKMGSDPAAVVQFILTQLSSFSAISRMRPDGRQMADITGFMLNGLPWSEIEKAEP